MDPLQPPPSPNPDGGDPFINPLGLPPTGSPSPTGYLGASHDEEVAKIRRKISPLGKVLILLSVLGVAGAGFFAYRQGKAQEALEHTEQEGLRELDRLTDGSTPREQIADRVRAIYPQYRASVKFRTNAWWILATLKDAQSAQLMVDGLTGNESERVQAAKCLAQLGLPGGAIARDPLMNALRQATDLSRAEVAWALVVLEEPRAWDTVVQLLMNNKLQNVTDADEPPKRVFDPTLIARMAGVERLVALTTFDVGSAAGADGRRLILKNIAAIGLTELVPTHPNAYQTLTQLVSDPNGDVAREAAVGIGRSGNPDSGRVLNEFLNRNERARDAVINTLAANAGAPALSVLIRATNDKIVRRVATQRLRELHDPDSGDAFAHALSVIQPTTTDEHDVETLKDAMFGLAELGDPRAGPAILAIVDRVINPASRDGDAWQQTANLGLGLLRRIPGGVNQAKTQLLHVLDVNTPLGLGLRTLTLQALGASGDLSLAPRLRTFLSDDNAVAGAGPALAQMRDGPGIRSLRERARRPANQDLSQIRTEEDRAAMYRRRHAIRSLSWSGDASIANDMMTIMEDPRDWEELRAMAAETLAAIATDETLQTVLTRARDRQKPEVSRLAYIGVLQQRATPAIVNQLVQDYLQVGGTATSQSAGDLMRATAIAAGLHGDQSTAQLLVPLVRTTNDPQVKINAMLALILCGDQDSAGAVLDALIPDRRLQEVMLNLFSPRGAGASAALSTEPQESHELMPLTAQMFDDGRIFRRMRMALALERGRGSDHFNFVMGWLGLRLKRGWPDSPMGLGPFEVRAKIREAATGRDAERSDTAFRLLRSTNDRGTLLWLRRQTGSVSERARRELQEMGAAR